MTRERFEELVASRNTCDGLVHAAKKTIQEAGENATADEKSSELMKHLAAGMKPGAFLLAAAFVANLVLGQFNPGFAKQPVSHTMGLWNFLGMTVAGLAFALAGGCPGRQLFMAGEGDGDAGIFVLGMIAGAAFAHNFGLAGAPDKVVEGLVQVGGPALNGRVAVMIGLAVCIALGFGMRERWERAASASGGGRSAGPAAAPATTGKGGSR